MPGSPLRAARRKGFRLRSRCPGFDLHGPAVPCRSSCRALRDEEGSKRLLRRAHVHDDAVELDAASSVSEATLEQTGTDGEGQGEPIRVRWLEGHDSCAAYREVRADARRCAVHLDGAVLRADSGIQRNAT